jgi:DNA polymerase III gamma/tau subunit
VRDGLSLLDQLRAFSQDQVDEEAVATVLGVPRFEQMVSLVEILAAGDASAGLAVLRQELAAGHDATALYHEVGRVLQSLLVALLEPEAESELSDEQRAEVHRVAAAIGLGGLTRMLGLWLEQEGLLRDAQNRELALEVACLRLSRWPAVQQLEAVLAGGEIEPVQAPPAPSQRRSRQARARPSAAAPSQRERDPAAAAEPREQAAAPQPSADSELLEREVRDDPQLAMVRRVLGGEVVSFRRDGNDS